MKVLAVFVFVCTLAGQTPPPDLGKKLRDARYELHVENGKFNGGAAAVLQTAIAQAKYVAIGEDHITAEIPQFASAVCNVMGPLGLAAMAIETSPRAAAFVASTFGKPDRLARMGALMAKYPDAVAFQNVKQENDLVDHCASVAGGESFHLWGLDQEFVGSGGWVLDEILETHPGPAATEAIKRLKEEEQRDAAAAQATDPSKLFLMAAPMEELDSAAALLAREGNAKANADFRELRTSAEIYRLNQQGSPESNNERARLMKQNFAGDMRGAAITSSGKVLLKFGEWHLYKGFNPLQQRDLGDYVAELADGEGSTSLHICVLGAKGTHFTYGGYKKPAKTAPFVMDEDPDYKWMTPAIKNQVENGWTLYDLRKLRFQGLGSIDPDFQRLIYGYDFLVIIPELTPATMIH